MLRKGGKGRKSPEKVQLSISCLDTILTTEDGTAESLGTCAE